METLEKTTDYDRFTHIRGNRPLNEIKVRRLMKSFQEKYLKAIITVNGKGQVVDGQHRLEAAKRLNLPIWIWHVNGYGLNDVQRFNTNNDVWRNTDFLRSYCELGVPAYLRLKEFMDNYPEFSLAASETIVTNNPRGARDAQEIGNTKGLRGSKTKPFREGQLKIDDLPLAYENAGKIRAYKPFYDGYNRTLFVQTLISLFKNHKFDNNEMIHKLEVQSTELVDCQSMEQYKLLIERIYNFKNREKINLRY